MDQNIQPPSQASPLPAQPIPPPPKKNLGIFIGIILLFLGIAVGLALGKTTLLSTLRIPYLSATPTPLASPEPTADWKTYTDPILKFSIQYPNDMTLEIMNNDIYLSLVSFKNNNTQFSVYVRESNVENEVKLIRAQTEGHVVTTLVKNEAFQINGINGWLLEYTPQSGNINRSTLIIPNKTNVYVINAQSDVFDQILSTFKFIGQPIVTPAASYTCPPSGYVDCMPILTPEKQAACSKEAMTWYKSNCPDFKGGAL